MSDITRIVAFATLFAAALIGCGRTGEDTHSAPSTVVATESTPAVRTDSSGQSDSTVHRAVLRVERMHENGGADDARSLITFADTTTLEIPLFDAQLIYELPVENRASWLLLSGVECYGCDASLSVWAFRASPGRVTTLPRSYSYPGDQFVAGLDSVLSFRSRLLVGACSADRTPSVVWFEHTLQPDSAQARRIRILEAAPMLHERVLPWDAAVETSINDRVTTKACREIGGIAQHVM